MKKVLAFVLVLAMVLGSVSMAFAAATKYPDDAAITNKEAVGVLSGLKVLEGDANGFRPADTLTRAEAAAILARLLLGRDDADKLTASAALFTDVPANHWAAGYIAYCVSQGIIAGNGDGTFNPDGVLTVPAFGKMLLCALGYDAQVEGLVGSNWEANTASLMVKANIAVSATGACTRDTAALMGLKTLEADMVEYASKGVTVNTGSAQVTVGGSSASKITPYATYQYNGNDGVEQLAERVFKGKLTKVTAATDTFGRPGTTWTYTDSVAGKYVGEIDTFGKSPVATFTGKMTAAQINSSLGGYQMSVAGELKSVNNTTNYTAATSVTAITNNTGAAVLAPAAQTLAKVISDVTADGKLVEVYADKGVITKIVGVQYTVGEVKSVSESKTKTSYTVDNTTFVIYTDGTKDSDTGVIEGTIAKGDIVTYVTPQGGKTYVYPTTKVTGSQTSFNTSTNHTTVTVNGETYTVATGLTNPGAFNNDDDVTINLDKYGFAVKSTAAESKDYAYVLSAFAKTGTDGLGKATVTPSIKVLLADGTVSTYTIKTKTSNGAKVLTGWSDAVLVDKNGVTGGGIASVAALDDKIITYSINDSELKVASIVTYDGTTADKKFAVDVVTAGGVAVVGNAEIKAGSTKYEGAATTAVANAGSSFVVYNTDKETASTYNGVSNVPKITVTRSAIAAVYKAGSINTIQVAFVIVDKAISANSASYAYVKTSDVSTSKSGDDTFYTYTSSYDKAGEKISVTRKNDTISPAGVYNISADNAYVEAYDAQYIKTGIAIVNDDILEISGSGIYYKITADTATVLVHSDATKVDKNPVVLVMSDVSNHTDEILTIYVTGSNE